MSHRARSRRPAIYAAAALTAGAIAAAGTVAFGESPQTDSGSKISAACESPADAIGLGSAWALHLPIKNPAATSKPLTIPQPQLKTYKKAPYFTTTPDCEGILFRGPVNGVTTTNTGYPRSELREMSGDGTKIKSWPSTSGTHTLTFDEAITHLPNDKPHVMAGQIHDETSDVTSFRLEGTKLYITSYNNSHYKLVNSNYKLGTRFTGKFVASGGKVKVYYNDALKATVTARFSSGYFKAGAYTQANCGNSSPCSNSNYAEVALYKVALKHS
ncbi:polysaccharide lyase family 7 protein [Streptomyces sp. NPDC057137]|uniref:polysaccharide lyase family 7 protein n=1 Tax=Streptomyces sp. NPDC057137 TaxID=3346030 RepID=UPI0036417C1D